MKPLNKKDIIDTERYGDCCEVNYGLIFDDVLSALELLRSKIEAEIENNKMYDIVFCGKVLRFINECIQIKED